MDATSFLNSTTFPTRLNSLDWKTVFFISLYTLIGFTVIVCNITVIATYWRFSDAKKDVANTFIVNLSYSDLLVGIINTPLVAIVEFYQGQWVFGEISCKIVLAVIYLDTFIPIVIMLMFIAHRRISISRNAKTRNFLRRRHINITMTFIWAILLFFLSHYLFWLPWIKPTRLRRLRALLRDGDGLPQTIRPRFDHIRIHFTLNLFLYDDH